MGVGRDDGGVGRVVRRAGSHGEWDREWRPEERRDQEPAPDARHERYHVAATSSNDVESEYMDPAPALRRPAKEVSGELGNASAAGTYNVTAKRWSSVYAMANFGRPRETDLTQRSSLMITAA